MPHLVRWHDELAPFGLVIAAPHVGVGEPAEITKKSQSLKLPFGVTHRGEITGSNIRGIPRSYLFDHDGKMIYEGHPSEAEKRVRLAVGAALAAQSGVKDAAGPIKAQLDALKKGTSPAVVLQKLLPLAKASDKGTADQAKAIVEALCATGQKQFDDAEADVSSEPLAAFDRVHRLAQSFKGTPLATKAVELTGKLRSDKTVAQELKARPGLESVRKLDANLSAAIGDRDPKAPEVQKALAGPLKQLKKSLTDLKRTAPDAKATEEALALGEKYGVVVK